MVAGPGRSGQARARAPRRVSGYRARAPAGSRAPMRTRANTGDWTGTAAEPWAGAWTRAWAGAGEGAGAGAVAVTRTRQGAVVVAVVELRAGDRALAGAVLLIAVPGRRWGSLGVG